MLLIAALSAFIGLGSSKNILEVPLQIDTEQAVFPVGVGTKFVINGVYKSSTSGKNIAHVTMLDEERNMVFLLQLRFNFATEPLGDHLDYLLVTSKHGNKFGGPLGYGKRYKFPIELKDELEIKILLEVTKEHYEITINGVKSTESMINSRENVEYFKTKTLKVKSSSSFSFKTSLQLIKIGEQHLIVCDHKYNSFILHLIWCG